MKRWEEPGTVDLLVLVLAGFGWDAIAIPIAVLSVYGMGMRGSLRTV